ncbi:hypothetical protein DSS3PM1_00014 [Bacteriophage DSS3_PM1]|nr:hypothetical protein DSS3PM1_00014 [Bacteriophage DSS3_PM1]
MGNMDTYTDGLVMISRREGCPHCESMKIHLENAGLKPQVVFSDNIRELFIAKHQTVPQLYFRGELIGDAAAIRLAHQLGGNDGVRRKALKEDKDEYGLF